MKRTCDDAKCSELLTVANIPLTFTLCSFSSHAVMVSEGVPFLEYDLHKQLIYKLRLLGMNAIFNLRTQLSIGDNIMVLYAQGTAVCLESLPRPEPLTINTKSQETLPIYSKLRELSLKNVRHWSFGVFLFASITRDNRLSPWESKMQHLTHICISTS